MFCPRPFVDEGCQVPAAPAAEPSAVPGWIFSGEKELSHSSLRSVPTSPAARDAREFTGNRRSHGETAGFGSLVCKPLQAGGKHLPWRGICRQRTYGEGLARLREGRLLTCLSTGQGCFRMLLQHGGQTPAAAGNPVGEARVAFWGPTRGLIPGLGQEQDQDHGGCRRGRGRATAPAPGEASGSAGHHQPPCPSSQRLPVKAVRLQPVQGAPGGLSPCFCSPLHFPQRGSSRPCHTLLRAATRVPGDGLGTHWWVLRAALWGELPTPPRAKPGGCKSPRHPPSGPQPHSLTFWPSEHPPMPKRPLPSPAHSCPKPG